MYGPPRHVELIGAAVESLDVGAMERNRKTVRVVPLRFASASDRSFGQNRIRGLASVLTAIYAGPGTGAGSEVEAPSMVDVQPEKLRALQGVMGHDSRLSEVVGRKQQPATGGQAGQKAAGQASARGLQSPVDDDAAPVFQADEGTNAIVIHGRPQRMAEYVDLIHRLDIAPQLVELEATIIDISSDSVESLGIDWSVKGARASGSVTQPPESSATSGFSIATLWSNAGRELMARIDVLSAQGKARVIAKPKVLGVANRAAVMREKRVVTVRVAGNLEANVFQIEAGTLLQVTPQVTSMPDPSGAINRIKLSLYIEDGNFEQGRVDNIPIVKRTEISTEAHVSEGESLLIGGITTTHQASQLDEVPGIARIPLLGALFRHRSDRVARTERLFLISPRLIRDTPRALSSLPVLPAPAPASAAGSAAAVSVAPAAPAQPVYEVPTH